ncbi:WXG100 family type VII secretion target [Streptomyces armeniacus]|uniref:ESAT-6-like protein n=1 Tax=Streptomyces armeniacus TaxID=83291 RepID=A0A345XUT7_9ACTN|nr:WXG100 family type VII secretion target [Streptomyces armeniacus]AXK35403.1 WXG100 family type VII secretion target [Streptomyces armeniacus]
MTIKITYGTVTAAADDINSAATTIEGELEALNARVAKVVGTWDGDAKAAYNAKHAGWDTNVKGLTSTLRALSQAVHGAAGGYQRTDKKAAQQFDF